MEKDIEYRIKRFLDECEDGNWYWDDGVDAIENLIKGYRELEENKELKTIKGFEENIEVSKFGEWVGKNYIDYKFEYENYQRILADYIPKSKIKELKEENEKKIEAMRQFKHSSPFDFGLLNGIDECCRILLEDK